MLAGVDGKAMGDGQEGTGAYSTESNSLHLPFWVGCVIMIGFLMSRTDKGYRGDASQFFVAGELCRRELVAVVTLGNCPNTDILVSNSSGTRFAHVQVKTFVPGNRTVSVGRKSERDFGSAFFWVLAGIPTPESEKPFEYFIVPSADMAKNVQENFEIWARTPGVKGQRHNVETNTVRTIRLPPKVETNGWSLEPYRDRWDLIVDAVST